MPLPNDDRDRLRRCRDCGEWKPIDVFCANSKRPDGKGSYCEPCFNERSKASYARRVKAKFDRDVRQGRVAPDGHKYCPDCQTVKPLDDFPRNRSDSTGYASYCQPCHNAKYHLRRRYGIGQKEVDELFAEQGGVCAICGAPDPEHVDHDHATGWVRGILCFNCNGGLGQFRDSPEYLANAITYLKGSTCLRVLIHPGVYQIFSRTRGRPPSRSFSV